MRLVPALSLMLWSACAGAPEAHPDPVEPESAEGVIELSDVGPDPQAVAVFAEALVRHPAVAQRLEGGRSRQLLFQLDPTASAGAEILPSTRFLAVYFNYDKNDTFEVRGDLDTPDQVTIATTSARPAPTLDEVDDASDLVLAADADLASRVASGELELYRAMPPLVSSPSGDRIIPVGIRATQDASGDAREIVGANLSARTVAHYADRTPPTSRVVGATCNAPPGAHQASSGRGALAWSKMVLKNRGQTYWSMNVTRPSASSGTNGSGIDLTEIRYKGKRMLAEANLPILNVKYDADSCGPYRDWQWEESPFTVGTTLSQRAPGIRIVSSAHSMRQTGTDTGNFHGTAATWDPTAKEWVLISELAAGWYRYTSEWRFALDGTITARFGFDAVRNNCTCRVHTHHAYWRLDFALGAGDNRFDEYSAATQAWTPIATEDRRLRDDADHRSWRVSDATSGDAVLVSLGQGQDAADAWGLGDAWFLVARPREMDDTQVLPLQAEQAGIDAFLDGEDVTDVDNVMWAAGHFIHDDASPAANLSHTVSLKITPSQW